jgi:hypothetical protein
VPKRLGFRLDTVVEKTEPEAPGETDRSMVWITP